MIYTIPHALKFESSVLHANMYIQKANKYAGKLMDRLCHMSMRQFPVGAHRHIDSEYFVSMLEILGGLVADLVVLIESLWVY